MTASRAQYKKECARGDARRSRGTGRGARNNSEPPAAIASGRRQWDVNERDLAVHYY